VNKWTPTRMEPLGAVALSEHRAVCRHAPEHGGRERQGFDTSNPSALTKELKDFVVLFSDFQDELVYSPGHICSGTKRIVGHDW
jgi:hypothetical protein